MADAKANDVSQSYYEENNVYNISEDPIEEDGGDILLLQK